MQKLWLHPLEDRDRAFRPQRRIAAPAIDDGARIGAHLRQVAGLTGGKEALGQFADPRQPRAQPLAPARGVALAHHPGQAVDPLGIGGQVMGLRIADHLDAVFHLAMGAVKVGQFRRIRPRHPALCRQRRQPLNRAPVAQIGVAAARDQLPGLGKELDLPYPADAKLHVMAFQHDRPVQPLVVADAQAHVMRVLDGGKVQMPAPDEGGQGLQEPLPRRDIARAGARLDEGRALPRPALRLVILLGRRHRDADRRDRGIGAQPQVGAKDIALGRQVRQHRRHPPHDADEGGPRLLRVVGVIAGFVEKADQVDVGGIVQLPRAHLAHGKRHDPGGGVGIFGRSARYLAAPDLIGGQGHQRRMGGAVGQRGQRTRHLLQPPDAAQIAKPRQKRHAPLGLAQRRAQGVACQPLGRGQRPRQRLLRRSGKGGVKPVGLALHQPGQIGAAPRRSVKKR